jgi:hypothetical protein
VSFKPYIRPIRNGANVISVTCHRVQLAALKGFVWERHWTQVEVLVEGLENVAWPPEINMLEFAAKALSRFGQDVLAPILPLRALALRVNGYPEAALEDASRGIKHSREINHPASLMLTMTFGMAPYILCGRYAAAKSQSDEIVALADEKGHVGIKGVGTVNQGLLMALTGIGVRGDSRDRLRDRRVAVDGGERCSCRFSCPIWREPMRSSGDLTRLGAPFVKRSR